MSLFEAVLLGIIQGLTEFLPVSSSGHIELGKALLGVDMGEQGMLMTVTLHGATALSTIVVFRKEVMEIIKGLLKFQRNEETEFSLKIILSMIPAAVIGLTMEDTLDDLFNGNILLVGCMLLLTAVLLFLADKAKNTTKPVGYKSALIVGFAQAIAILPGISRSGATISTSVLLGIDRSRAARFSFLMVVPLILGKMAKDVLDGAFLEQGVQMATLSVGFIAAFISGLAACTWMISIVKKAKLKYFAFYCIIAGSLAIGSHFL